jgi:putative DNA primase/helicase
MGAETIASTLGGAYRSGAWWRCCCPVHNSSGGTLAVRDAPSGGVRVRCHAGCRDSAVLAELRRRGLVEAKAGRKKMATPDPEAAERQRQEALRDRNRRIQIASWIWRDTTPANFIIETYLGGRLILAPIPSTIRLHWSLRHREAGCKRPAMVGLVEHVTDGPVGVHCTYLAVDGSCKASVEPAKRFIGPVGGAAVHLAPAAPTLAVAEGIESGLSYQEHTGTPTWAALSALGIKQLLLPDEVEHVVIAADPDPVGIMAARAAARRWLAEGRRVSIARPPVGFDFNDMARVVLG